MTSELAVIDERTPGLLDYAVSSDASGSTVVFEVTVEASDGLEALKGAVSWVRAAFHAEGCGTPGWDADGATKAVTTYEIDPDEGGVDVRQLVKA